MPSPVVCTNVDPAFRPQDPGELGVIRPEFQARDALHDRLVPREQTQQPYLGVPALAFGRCVGFDSKAAVVRLNDHAPLRSL